MLQRYLFITQRLTAILLLPCVLVHLALILFAARGGLSGAEILGRTQGSIGWALFYLVFVIAVSIHAPIGISNVLREWGGFGKTTANSVALLFALFLLIAGLRSVAAIY